MSTIPSGGLWGDNSVWSHDNARNRRECQVLRCNVFVLVVEYDSGVAQRDSKKEAMPTTGQIIRQRRELLGLTQLQVAKHMGKSERLAMRWEADEAQIDFPVQATKLGMLLGLTMDEMAGLVPIGLDLGGQWTARWHTSRNGEPVIDKHELVAGFASNRLTMDATGDYRWRGELQVTGYDLTGTYRSVEVDAEHRGALYFWLHPNTQSMIGHWVGRSADCVIGTGWGVLARDPERADQLIAKLIERGYKNLTEWPNQE